MSEETANTNSPSPYAGRWVALVRGRVVAQGGTPSQVLRAYQSSRYKEKPEIRFMPVSFALPPLIEKIRNILPPGQEAYLVGGAVRDLLTSRLSPDLDFALPSSGISLARTIANSLQADFMVLDDERDTGRVILTNENDTFTYLDFATFRGANLENDLRDRDFTINAIAFNLQDGTIIDPLGGANDIRARVIRACSPDALSNDPVRILRAVRLAAALGFTIDKKTREWMKHAADKIGRVSVERLRDEVFKILAGQKAGASFRALEMLGVLPYLMPELVKLKGVTQSPPHIHEVWTHTLAVLDYLDLLLSSLRVNFDAEKTSDMYMGMISLKIGRYREKLAGHFSRPLNPNRPHRSLLFFAALYHDVCKPDTRTVDEDGRIRFFDHEIRGAEVAAERARFFNLSNDEVERLSLIVKHHMRIHNFATRLENAGQPPSRKAVYRFFRDSDSAGVDLVLLALADVRGTRGTDLTERTWAAYLDIARILLESYWEKPEEVVNPPRLLDGNELMKELNLKPGRVIGQLLELIRENQAAGSIGTKEEAIAFAKEELPKLTGEA
ncbi:MAG: HD domain-containing protein [Anaerolineales bacterium]|nr:HD domain-containing protein [Anaerolineales bacterium]